MSLSEKVRVRDFRRKDIPRVLDYWFRSPPGFVEAMAVDPGKLPDEATMRQILEERCRQNENLSPAESRMPALTLLVGEAPVGLHLVNGIIPGEKALFHAHLWDSAHRGQGITRITGPLACEAFFLRFRLKRILFQMPVQNKAGLRALEKSGLRSLGTEIIDSDIVRAGTEAKCFEVTREELESYLGRPLSGFWSAP